MNYRFITVNDIHFQNIIGGGFAPILHFVYIYYIQQLSSPPVFSGVRVTRSLVLYVCFVDRCLSFCTFSFGHCVVCSSSIYGF